MLATLKDWRKRIDEIDLKLVDLLNERSRCAIGIGRIKGKESLRIYDPDREEDVIRNVENAARGPLSREALRRLFERIIDESRRAERECLDSDRREEPPTSSGK